MARLVALYLLLASSEDCEDAGGLLQVKQGTAPVLELSCQGDSFLDCFDFFTEKDPTHGEQEYVNRSSAEELNLYRVRNDSVYLGSLAGINGPPKSIRVETKKRFGANHLSVIDVKHMPTGRGSWPAFWSYGPDWPNNGEVDIIETIHRSETASATMASMHTRWGCHVPYTMRGFIEYDCNKWGGHTGCKRRGPEGSASKTFNSHGGGVFATLWTGEGIKFWFWARSDIPDDITKKEPDISSWGPPYVTFPFGPDCSPTFFQHHVFTINTAFCGDWAGALFEGSFYACSEFVRNPNNVEEFKDTFWLIDYLNVYSV